MELKKIILLALVGFIWYHNHNKPVKDRPNIKAYTNAEIAISLVKRPLVRQLPLAETELPLITLDMEPKWTYCDVEIPKEILPEKPKEQKEYTLQHICDHNGVCREVLVETRTTQGVTYPQGVTYSQGVTYPRTVTYPQTVTFKKQRHRLFHRLFHRRQCW